MLVGQMMNTQLTITSIMEFSEKVYPNSEIVSITGDTGLHRYTYADAFRRSRQLANALTASGVQSGDRIATLAWNDYRHFELYYAVSCSGAVCHTINPRLFPEQIDFIVNHAEDKLLFIDPDFLPIVEGLADKLTRLQDIIVLSDDAHLPETSLTNVQSYEAYIADQSDQIEWPEEDIEQQAADWLIRLDGDRAPSAAELEELKAWMQRSPAHKAQLKRLTQYWHRANLLTELSIPLPDSKRPNGLFASLRYQFRQLFTYNWQATTSFGAALTLTVAVVTGLLLINPDDVSGNGIYETRIGEQNSITLVDGSVIQLNTDSHIQVNYEKNQRSIVLMAGEAHFEVAKDPSRPFVVKAGDGMVRAVGTRLYRAHKPRGAKSNRHRRQSRISRGDKSAASNNRIRHDANSSTTNRLVRSRLFSEGPKRRL